MKTTDLIPLEQASSKAIANMFGVIPDDEFQSGARAGFPVISIKGKVFALVRGEDRVIVTKPGEDGEPARSLEIVVLRAVKGLSKTYYKGSYVEGSTDAPDCYSNDGITPALDAESPQAKSCAECPHNVWGSRITEEGKKSKSCADAKRLAVSPLGQINDPMLLRLPGATLKGWDQYVDGLKKKGLTPPMVATRVSFDWDAAYPLLTFKPIGILPAEIAKEVAEARDSDVAMQIVGAVRAPTEHAADAEETVETTKAEPEPETKPVKAKATRANGKTKPKAEAKPAEDDEDEGSKLSVNLDGLDEALAELGFDDE